MINLTRISKKHREGGSHRNKNTSLSLLRLTKDINDLNPQENCKVEFPDPNNICHFTLKVRPNEGFYKGISICFEFNVPENYPVEPPKVKCLTEIFHPNIDLDGNVCLNILREDWRPVLSITSIIYGLQFLLLEPNTDDPLNKKAADQMMTNPQRFSENVKRIAKGLPLRD